MKNTLVPLLLALAPVWAFAQHNEGRVRYIISNDWTKQMAGIDYISKQQRERQAYIWGKTEGWKTYADLFFKDQLTRYEDSDDLPVGQDRRWQGRREAYAIERDWAADRERALMYLVEKNWLVEDSIWRQDWKILNEIKEVAGHQCMKATWTDSIKSKRIVAWFALDFPLPSGPDRFGGLPGLILELDANDGAMNIAAEKIELGQLPPGALDFPKKPKGKKISQADFAAKLRASIDEKKKAEQPWIWGIRY